MSTIHNFPGLDQDASATVIDVRFPMQDREPNQQQIDKFVRAFVESVGSRPAGQSEEDAIDSFLEEYRRSLREHAA